MIRAMTARPVGPRRSDVVKRQRRSFASLRPLRGDYAAPTWRLAAMSSTAQTGARAPSLRRRTHGRRGPEQQPVR